MADEQPQQKYLSDFKGDAAQRLKEKSEFISKYGFEAFEQVVLNSRKSVQR